MLVLKNDNPWHGSGNTSCFITVAVHFNIREVNVSGLTNSREATAFCKHYLCAKQEQFAMLAVRLSDMLWLLQFLSSFLVVLMVGASENGRWRTV